MPLTALLHKITTALRDETCRYCQTVPVRAQLFCTTCRETLGWQESQPLKESNPSQNAATIYAACRFNPTLKGLLYPYKFYHRTRYQECLSDILIDYWSTHPELSRGWLVTSIPSRWQTNHLVPLAQRFAQAFRYAYQPDLLLWQRPTQPQHQIKTKAHRLANVHNSMQVREKAEPLLQKESASQGILILDDMTTTGATLQEAFRAIQSVSPSIPVVALALCHVPLGHVPLDQVSSGTGEMT